MGVMHGEELKGKTLRWGLARVFRMGPSSLIVLYINQNWLNRWLKKIVRMVHVIYFKLF